MPLSAEYQKSPLSGNGDCIEVRRLENGRISLRDSKDPSRPAHEFTPQEWLAFLGGVRETKIFDL